MWYSLPQPAMFVLIGLVLALAATVQSASGFGFNLLAAPLLVFILPDTSAVVPALHVAWFPLGVALMVRNRREINPSRVVWWLVPAVPGAFLGVWLLTQVRTDATVLRRSVGAVTVIAAILLALKARRPLKRERLWMAGAGSLSGLLGGSTAMAGPPLLVLGLNQGWSAGPFRSDLLCYFLLLSIVTIAMYVWRDLLTATSLGYAAAGLPGLVAGFFIGTWLARHVSGDRFRYIAIALLCIAGVMPWIA